jgi:hypothetical protein
VCPISVLGITWSSPGYFEILRCFAQSFQTDTEIDRKILHYFYSHNPSRLFHHYITITVSLKEQNNYNVRGLRAGQPRSRSPSPSKGKILLLFTVSIPVLEPTQPPIQWERGVKRPGREANHSLPTSAKVKKTRINTSIPPYAFMA